MEEVVVVGGGFCWKGRFLLVGGLLVSGSESGSRGFGGGRLRVGIVWWWSGGGGEWWSGGGEWWWSGGGVVVQGWWYCSGGAWCAVGVPRMRLMPGVCMVLYIAATLCCVVLCVC